MSTKIIEYDLRGSETDYEKLYGVIKSYGTWAHITESTWFIKTNATCTDIRDRILTVMDSNDRLFVAELTGVAAWRNTLCSNDFIKANL